MNPESVRPLIGLVLLLLAGCAQEPAAPSSGAADEPPALVLSPPPPPPDPHQFAAIEPLAAIHFDFATYAIRPDDARTLDRSTGWLRSNPGYLLLVEGHCDERGTDEYNLALGDRRADAARRYLIGRGVPAARIVAISYGKERPVCTEHGEPCWAQNRRASFLVKSP